MANTIEWRNLVQMQVDAGQKAAAMQREAALQAAAISAGGFEKGATMGSGARFPNAKPPVNRKEEPDRQKGIIGYLDGEPIYKEES